MSSQQKSKTHVGFWVWVPTLPGVGMPKRILGGKVWDMHEKYGMRKCRRKMKYMGVKGREGSERKYAGGGASSGHVQEDFGSVSAGQNGKYGKIKKVQETRKYIRE